MSNKSSKSPENKKDEPSKKESLDNRELFGFEEIYKSESLHEVLTKHLERTQMEKGFQGKSKLIMKIQGARRESDLSLEELKVAMEREKEAFDKALMEEGMEHHDCKRKLTTDGTRALVFAGGANRLTLQLGAFANFLTQHPGYDADIISCCSAGALLGSFLAMDQKHGSHSLTHQAEKLKKLLFSLETSSIYKKRFPVIGWIMSFFQKGFFNTKPLNRLIETHIDPVLIQYGKRKVYVAVYHLNEKKYVEVDETATYFLEFVKASPAFPFFFPSVEVPPRKVVKKMVREARRKSPYGSVDAKLLHQLTHRQFFRDGGVTNIIPTDRLLREHRPSRIDVFLASPIQATRNRNKPIKNILDDTKSTLLGTYGEVFQDDLIALYEYAEAFDTKVFIYAPYQQDISEDLDPLDFSSDILKVLFKYGLTIKGRDITEILKGKSHFLEFQSLKNQASGTGEMEREDSQKERPTLKIPPPPYKIEKANKDIDPETKRDD